VSVVFGRNVTADASAESFSGESPFGCDRKAEIQKRIKKIYIFFEKGIAFSEVLWYNTAVAEKRRTILFVRTIKAQSALWRYLAYGENTNTLRLTSKLVDLRVWYAKWIQ
jgi:hypothetical protein